MRVERRPEGFWGVGAAAGFPRQLCNERWPDRTTHVREVLRDAARPMKKQADGSAQSSGRGSHKRACWREEAISQRLCTESAKCAFSVAGAPGRPLLPGWRWCARRSSTRRRRWERRRRSARACRGRSARICAKNGGFQGGHFSRFSAPRAAGPPLARADEAGACAPRRGRPAQTWSGAGRSKLRPWRPFSWPKIGSGPFRPFSGPFCAVLALLTRPPNLFACSRVLGPCLQTRRVEWCSRTRCPERVRVGGGSWDRFWGDFPSRSPQTS